MTDIHAPIVSENDPRFIKACKQITQLAANRPQGGYSVLYFDDPWYYRNWSSKGADRGALKHYPCISTELLCRLPVGALAADNAVMLMWVTWPNIFEAEQVIQIED